ncbi:MAG: hypothetical protein CMO55_14625 [Verrucomicrobiales bacterium]|nr:hypothetical protein [Verrucomicrobiales bacterium]
MIPSPSFARNGLLAATLLLSFGLSQAADRISQDANGTAGNGPSAANDVTPDGKFAVFTSDASNLVGLDDDNGLSDVFVYERATGELTLVATNDVGEQTAAASSSGSISNDGLVVAFQAIATDLVSGEDDDGFVDIYVKNLEDNSIELASLADDPMNEPNADCLLLGLSGNGKFVLFASVADNLVDDDDNMMLDLFVRDLDGETTTRVSVADGGAELTGTGPSWGSISDDGTLVVFATDSANVVTDDFNTFSDVFLHSVGSVPASTVRISMDFNDEETNGDSNNPVIAGNGLYVAFDSDASDLVDGDANDARDVFIYDIFNDQTQIVSLTTNRSQVDQPSSFPTISGNGRFVGFTSASPDFDNRYSGSGLEGFYKDLQTNSVELANITKNNQQGNGAASIPLVSSNGALVFTSNSTNLVNGGGGSETHAFYTKPKTPKIVVNQALKAAFKKKIKKAKFALRKAKRAGKKARVKKLKRKIRTLRKRMKKI